MSYDLSRTLFSMGNKNFTCSEFLEALKFFGIYDEWCAKIAKGKTLAVKAEEDGKEIDRDILSEMTNDFRYSEKLLTSEEFNLWVDSVGLGFGDFEAYLKRTYWSENEDEFTAEINCDVSDQEFFSELYFSRSIKGLINSWQKRLLAWFDKNGSDFPDLEKLNENYREYEVELLKHFDEDLWVSCFSKELTYYHFNCLQGEKENLLNLSNKENLEKFEDISKSENLKLMQVGLFFRDLPSVIQESLPGVKEGGVLGPVRLNESFVLCRLESITPASAGDSDVIEELQALFINDVWKTLEVKYVS